MLQPIDGLQNLAVQFGQRRAGLAQAAIAFGQAADAGAIRGGQRPEASLAVLAPGEHGGRVPRALRLGAMASGVSAARLDVINRTFHQLAVLEQVMQVARILGGQAVQDLALATGDSGGRAGALPAIHITGRSHTAYRYLIVLL